MIVTQTPLRISFAGGGTDFRDFYMQEEGWVVSSAIDKYIHVIIKERFDDKIRVGYTKTELVDDIDVRLFVTWADNSGVEEGYGGTMTQSESRTRSRTVSTVDAVTGSSVNASSNALRTAVSSVG